MGNLQDNTSSSIRVMIVDDSALMRKLLTQTLSRDPGIQVVDTAMDGQFALDHLRKIRPDVVLMDVDMPRLNGLEALEIIVSEYQLPVVMCSALTTAGAEATIQALAHGAVDFVEKPTLQALTSGAATTEITARVRNAATARVRSSAKFQSPKPASSKQRPTPIESAFSLQTPLPNNYQRSTIEEIAKLASETEPELIAIGTSTGGPPALERILSPLPPNFPYGIVIVQHMPPGFTQMLATHLNQIAKITVREAVHGERVTAGVALIAPGGAHLRVVRRNNELRVSIDSYSPTVSGHRPSVDVLFESVVKTMGNRAAGIIMTGMGYDGAEGMGKMMRGGALTIAQTPDSCVCYGMPKSAIDKGYARAVVALEEISSAIMACASLVSS
jgi:two-component system chemotaxis response regulator CheB